MLSRKVVTRRGRRFRGYFPSHKLGRMVAWESLLERDAIYLLEFSRGVVSYREQPTIVQYFDGCRMRQYYPDFELVLADDSRVHLEIKPSVQLAKPKIQATLRAISSHYMRQELHLRIATELEIRREPLLTNLRTLSYLLDRPEHVLPTVVELKRFFGSAPLCLGQVGTALGDEIAIRLVAAGHITCDLTKPLDANTAIEILKGGHNATVLL